MKIHQAFFLLLFATACNDTNTYKRNTEVESSQTIRFIPVSYGIAISKNSRTVEDSGSVTGHENYIEDFKIASETDTIPTQLGTEFGIHFMLESNLDKSVMLRKVWIFPTTLDNGHKTYSQSIRYINIPVNEETFSTYKLEAPYELLKGRWQLLFYYKDRLLYRKIFVLI